MWNDLRHAARILASRPGWTAVAVLSLALGIGVNTTAFSIADAMFLRPMPVASPEQMMSLTAKYDGRSSEGFFFVEYRELAAGTTAFSGVTAFSSRGAMLKQNGESTLMAVHVADGNYFDVLGVAAQLGRTLRPELDSSPDAQPAVVMSYGLWQRKFGGDPGIVGKTIQLNDAFVQVVGVMPKSFPGLERGYLTDLWESPAAWTVSTNARSDIEERRSRQFEVIARLKPGVTKEQALAQVAGVGRRLKEADPATNGHITFHAAMAREEQLAAAMKPVGILLAIVALVLWIACGNVAGLQLAQAEGRRREIGIRQALGASRARLVRQMITESALLAAAGTVVGLLLARWLQGMLPALLPPGPFQVDYGLRLDSRVYAFTLAAAVLTVLLFGLAPALRASKMDVTPALKDGAGSGRQKLWMRSFVVAAQIGLAVVLLNAAGLLLRSFMHTRAESPGFDTARNMACLFMVSGMKTFDGPEVTVTYERLREEAAALPGVRRVTYARRLPMFSSGGGATVKMEFPSLKLPDEQKVARLHYNEVGPGYFETIGTRVLQGRAFGSQDSAEGARVVMVSEALARQYFPKGGALDQHVLVRGKAARIVGIVENARVNSIHEPPQPFVYFPFAQMPSGESTLMMETLGDPVAVAAAAKKMVQRIAPEAMVLSTVTLEDHMKEVMFQDWVQAVLSSGVAALGVLLASVGLFAAVSYAVGRRTKEFGVRLALGAQRRDVFVMVVKQALLMAGVGAVVGLAGTLAASRLLRGVLYGVEPNDALTLAVSTILAALVAVAASLAPARRAVQVDPVQALRWE